MANLPTLQQRMSVTNKSLPYVFPPSQEWLGNDGSWSTFTIRLGNPPNAFHILPATNVQETWVPLPQACNSRAFDNCTRLRGIEGNDTTAQHSFQLNQSSTWVEEGIYNLLSEENLGYTGNGQYGFDTIHLGPSTLGGPSLDHQVVAGIVTNDFYLGIFGLGPKPANFSGYDDPIPSYMKTLVNENKISSFSYGYTAGAKHRLDGVHGSLTLGGYDQSRFISNNVSFSFGSDDSRRLTLVIQSITATNTLHGAVEPLSSGILALIDSTVPHIWLPTSACAVFERAFGLIYDNTTDLYIINDTTHEHLQRLNPKVTLKLGNSVSEGDTVAIQLPYGAFDLQASLPIYANETNYFPLRRAMNESQFTLGRTFLQEAYVTADYERMNFSVGQAVHTDNRKPQIIMINSNNNTANKPTGSVAMTRTSSSNLNPGQISGIALGSLALVVVVAVFGLLFVRHKRQQRRVETNTKALAELPTTKPPPSMPNSITGPSPKRDLSTINTVFGELPVYSQNNQRYRSLTRTGAQELLGSPAAAELES